MRLAPRGRRHTNNTGLWQTDLKIVLHVGCGERYAGILPDDDFPSSEWQEIRLDIDPAVNPDIVANIVDMPVVASASVDAIWSSHNLEHVFTHEVPLTLREFHRVLRPGGVAHVQVPDALIPATAIARGHAERPLYVSQAGPVTPLDMLFGFGPAIERGDHFMAHKTAFTRQSLARRFTDASFVNVRVISRENGLWATATRPN